MGKDVSVKYVFLDVVDYTTRTIEKQHKIVTMLQQIVRSAVAPLIKYNWMYESLHDYCVFLPTGDGMCIAIKNRQDDDIALIVALKIFENIHIHNSENEDLQFEVRAGINANKDIEYIDINDAPNFAGRGINMAQRIMNLCDGGNILVSSSVYETLAQRDKYHDKFRDLGEQLSKRDKIKIYQYVDESSEMLNNDIPSGIPAPAAAKKKKSQ
jgi:class 3 adenylate cyclase